MSDIDGIVQAAGLPAARADVVQELLNVFHRVQGRNALRRDYYEGDILIKDIGVDAVPPDIRIHFSCDWPARAVDAVAERCRFLRFSFEDGGGDPALDAVMRSSRLAEGFANHLPDELVHGCMAATVGRYRGRTFVRFHSAETCAMTWDRAAGRIGAGIAVADERATPWSPTRPVATRVNLHLPGALGTFERLDAARWAYYEAPTPMERPMMEAFCFRATGDKPFGRSRITRNVMDISDEVLRIKEYMAFNGAINAAPQKWIMNLTEDMFEKLTKNKWNTYIGSWLLATGDDDMGSPNAGQFPQSTPLPYIEMLRQQASDFSFSTGIPMSMLVDHDNPASEAGIVASSEGLVGVAESLIESSKDSLREVALMAMAVDAGTSIEALDERRRTVAASFRSPLRHTRSETADFAVKLATARRGFAQTDVFLEMMDFDRDEIARIKSQERSATAADTLGMLGKMLDGGGGPEEGLLDGGE